MFCELKTLTALQGCETCPSYSREKPARDKHNDTWLTVPHFTKHLATKMSQISATVLKHT